jgi:hypothetical protein
MDNFGGYPKEIFIDKVPDELTCGICLGVLKNPKQCKTGHSFCHSCVAKLLETKTKVCPSCKKKFNKLKELTCNILAKELIENLTVTCDDEDCLWRGPLHQKDTHEHLPIISKQQLKEGKGKDDDDDDDEGEEEKEEEEEEEAKEDEEEQDEGEDEDDDEETFEEEEEEIVTFSEGTLESRKRVYVGQVKQRQKGQHGPVRIVRHGIGVDFFYHADGTITERYSGEFRNGGRHGKGVIQSDITDRVIFSGEWRHGKKNGNGSLYNASGDFYKEGIWKKDKFQYYKGKL